MTLFNRHHRRAPTVWAKNVAPDLLGLLCRIGGGEVNFFDVLVLDPAVFPTVVFVVQVPEYRQGLIRVKRGPYGTNGGRGGGWSS